MEFESWLVGSGFVLSKCLFFWWNYWHYSTEEDKKVYRGNIDTFLKEFILTSPITTIVETIGDEFSKILFSGMEVNILPNSSIRKQKYSVLKISLKVY